MDPFPEILFLPLDLKMIPAWMAQAGKNEIAFFR
jgi:hypothetical protein